MIEYKGKIEQLPLPVTSLRDEGNQKKDIKTPNLQSVGAFQSRMNNKNLTKRSVVRSSVLVHVTKSWQKFGF